MFHSYRNTNILFLQSPIIFFSHFLVFLLHTSRTILRYTTLTLVSSTWILSNSPILNLWYPKTLNVSPRLKYVRLLEMRMAISSKVGMLFANLPLLKLNGLVAAKGLISKHYYQVTKARAS